MSNYLDTLLLTGTLFGSMIQSTAATDENAATQTTREQLIGAWQLVRVDVVGPSGPGVDPFYGTSVTGLIVYDASGWMSVQIVGEPRPHLDVPESRPDPDATAETNRKKAAALDTYYAYFGTWTYDSRTATVTHLVRGASYPSELGVKYVQKVRVEGNRMTFTRAQGSAGHEAVQTKVWERIEGR